MSVIYEMEEVLMVVKTYPTPSAAHGETICTGGIRLRDNAWIRIFPFPFRLAEVNVLFKKWDILRLPLAAPRNDPRPESRRLHDVRLVEHIRGMGTEDGFWTERMSYLLPTVATCVQEVLNGIPKKGNQNWGGTIRPVQIKPNTGRVVINRLRNSNWTADERAKLMEAQRMAQEGLYSDQPDPNFRQLRKFPYEFRLQFEDMTGAPYDFMVTDWEVPALYFRNINDGKSAECAIEEVANRMQSLILDPGKNAYAILGSTHFHLKQKNLIIGGFAYCKPPKEPKQKGPPQMRGLWDTDE
ncbi:hypothetical protein ACINK0_11055 [Deinococcus sp. VB343]|uniref:hypothetical protein n=1 Tax=Deinococcus sp. VB343 TaxID=3385567 RepID=UPI0039C8E5DF